MLKMFLNTIIVYLALILLLRVIGKRQLGELELSELIVTFLISESASEPILNPDASVLHVFIPIVTLLGLEFLMSVLSVKSVRFRALALGKPSLLIVHGRIDQTQMRKNSITPDELAEALRGQGILDLKEVEYAVLETNGHINIISSPAERPVTAGQMGVAAEDPGYPVTVIDSGRVLTDNLRLLGRDENWLKKQLRENGLSRPDEVYMMTADIAGGIFLAPKESGEKNA